MHSQGSLRFLCWKIARLTRPIWIAHIHPTTADNTNHNPRKSIRKIWVFFTCLNAVFWLPHVQTHKKTISFCEWICGVMVGVFGCGWVDVCNPDRPVQTRYLSTEKSQRSLWMHCCCSSLAPSVYRFELGARRQPWQPLWAENHQWLLSAVLPSG